jgi:hypothetical protein
MVGQNHFIGIKGGYSWTNIATDAFEIHKTQAGFSTGLTYDFVAKKKFSFSAELLYEQRGFIDELILTTQWNPSGEKYSVPFHFNYFALPLKFGWGFGNKFFGFANIGVSPAMLQKATATLPVFNYNPPNLIHKEDSTVVLTNPSEFDISGLAEVGCGYKISKKFTVTTSLRYQYSFTSITNKNFYKDYYMNHYQMTLSLSIKYNLSFKSQSETVPPTK